jgi:hypothetical protein
VTGQSVRGRFARGDARVDLDGLRERYGRHWEFWRGNGWFAVRRCGEPCRELQAHGWAHIVLAYSVQDLVKGLEAQPATGQWLSAGHA